MEEKWDVTAAAPVVAVAGAAAAGDAPASAEPTEFAVILEDVPSDKKIGVLKVVREVTGLALKEAKEMTEGLPKTVKEKLLKVMQKTLLRSYKKPVLRLLLKGCNCYGKENALGVACKLLFSFSCTVAGHRGVPGTS